MKRDETPLMITTNLNLLFFVLLLSSILQLHTKINNIVIPECKNFTYTPETTLKRHTLQGNRLESWMGEK